MLRRRRSGVNVRCHISGSSVSLSLSNLRWKIVPCIHVHTPITRYPLPTITGFSKNQRLVQSMIDTRKNSPQTVWDCWLDEWQYFMHSMLRSLKSSFWRPRRLSEELIHGLPLDCRFVTQKPRPVVNIWITGAPNWEHFWSNPYGRAWFLRNGERSRKDRGEFDGFWTKQGLRHQT